MKKTFTKTSKWLAAAMVVLFASASQAQTVSTFENVQLNPNSYYNGKDKKGGFASGNAYFQSEYDTSFGGYWSAGFAASNVKDSVKAGYTNLYAARTAVGYAGSSNYVVGQSGAKVRLTGKAKGAVVNGFYVTNSTFAALSMKNGDQFAKKFGGTTGNDPDFFKLLVYGYSGGKLLKDSVEFYLADYRSADNSKDYIVTKWTWLDLKKLGNVDSLQFLFNSSDKGQFGINTPTYFCMDNLTTSDAVSGVVNVAAPSPLTVFPNPASNVVYVNTDAAWTNSVMTIVDITGRELYREVVSQVGETPIDLTNMPAGVYFVTLQQNEKKAVAKFIKQ